MAADWKLSNGPETTQENHAKQTADNFYERRSNGSPHNPTRETAMNRASYSYTFHREDEAMPRTLAEGGGYPVLAIVDHDNGRSVTNDAENVLADLGIIFNLEKFRVIYRDSSGLWDELLVGPGTQHAGFAPLRKRELAEALQALDARYLEEWRAMRASISGNDNVELADG